MEDSSSMCDCHPGSVQPSDRATVAIFFGQFGPYHHARVRALQKALGGETIPVQISATTSTYKWSEFDSPCDNLQTLCEGDEESVSPLSVFTAARRLFNERSVDFAFLPSYAPARYLALLLAAKSCGVGTIMMNESHAGTERATGVLKWVKKKLVSLFDGAIVGGEPHRRYFTSLGMDPEKIVTGYDAIDNSYFTEAAAAVTADAPSARKKLGLPSRYLLSLGRLVHKKNLVSLVEAYAAFKGKSPQSDLKLAIVGSGECQEALITRCTELKLKHTLNPSADDGSSDVLFYGFRQIEENPAFYALSEAFVLPSLYEEWGLVVNEAMACGVPVIVSKTVGSAEDLVIPGVTGFHFEPTSVAELAGCIEELDKDPDLRRRMGEASLAHIQNWGCDNFGTNAKAILNRVMA